MPGLHRVSARGWRWTPSLSFLTRARLSPRARSRRGAAGTSPTTSSGLSKRSAPRSDSASTRRGSGCPRRPGTRCCAATTPRCMSATATVTAASARITPRSRVPSPTSSVVTRTRRAIRAGSGSRASCVRCPARRVMAAGSSRSRLPSASAASRSPISAPCPLASWRNSCSRWTCLNGTSTSRNVCSRR